MLPRTPHVLGACLILAAFVAPTASAQTFQPLQINFLPDLTVTLAATPSQVGGGQELTYTATIRNEGVVAFRSSITGAPTYFNTPANGIAILQTLPSGITFKSAVGTAGFTCAYVAPSVTCTGGNLQPATSASITIKVNAPLQPATLTSTIVVDPTNSIAESSDANNAASATASVPLPDLGVSVQTAQAQVDDGAFNSYRVYVTNAADGAEANGVSFRLTLPPGTTFWGAGDGVESWFSRIYLAGFTCSQAAGVVTCSGGRIGPGATGAATISVNAPRTNGPVSASVVVDPNNSVAERDESNNSASATYTVVGRPDLAITTQFWTLTPPPLVQRVTRVRNDGVGTASNITVLLDAFTFDPPPSPNGADDFISVLADGGFSCSRTGSPWPLGLYELGDHIRCSGGSLAPGATATITTYHMLHWNSPERRTTAEIDPQNAIREANEANNTASASARLW